MNNPDMEPGTLNPDPDTDRHQKKQSRPLDFYQVDSLIQIKRYSRSGIFYWATGDRLPFLPPPPLGD